MSKPVSQKHGTGAALRFCIAGAVEISPGQREEGQAAHGHIEHRTRADFVDALVGQRDHQLKEAFTQQDQHQKAEALRDVSELRHKAFEAERAYARQHVLQLNCCHAGGKHPVGDRCGQKSRQCEHPGQHEKIPPLFLRQRIARVVGTARPPVKIGRQRPIQRIAQREIRPAFTSHVGNCRRDGHHRDNLKCHHHSMRHVRGDIQRIIDRTVCPGIENRQEHSRKHPESLPPQMMGQVIPQNENCHYMDQIEEKFHPVHVVVGFIDIHVMAWSPPEKIVNYHTLPLCLIVLAGVLPRFYGRFKMFVNYLS